MNNNIIKSLRRTLLCTVAAATVTIGFTACADETFITQNTPAPANNGTVYKVTIPANIGGGDTRAVAYNSETGGYDGFFETTDNIFVYNITKNADSRKKSEEGDWWNTSFLYPDGNGKTANLYGELSFCAWDEEAQATVEIAPEVGDELLLYYKNSSRYIYYNIYNWSGENFIDYAIAKVTIESIDDNGVIKTSPASFIHPQSLYKINFEGIPSGVNIKKVIIESEQQKLVREYNPTNIDWPNYFGSVAYSYEGGTDKHELIFMLRFADNPDYQDMVSGSGDVITFKALADNHYYIGTKSVTNELVDDKYYKADLAMTDAGKAMTLTNVTTGEEIVVLGEWSQIASEDAAWIASNIGYNTAIEWYGGNNPLKFEGLSIFNSNNSNAIQVYSNSNNEETKKHYLVLSGENTIDGSGSNYVPAAIVVTEESSLNISEEIPSSRLNITAGGISLQYNSTMTIESGDISLNGYLNMWGGNSTLNIEGGFLTINGFGGYFDNSSCIISKDGKLRVVKDGWIPDGFVKAAEGYVLIVNDEGEYLAYTAIEDDGSGLAKSIVVTPTTATLGYGLSGGQGLDLRAYVYPETTTDKSVTWTTSNPDVVQIGRCEDDYVNVYSTGVGTATVTATTNDGSNLLAQCEITVKPFGGIWYEDQDVKTTPEGQPFINPLTKAGKITSVTYTSSDTSVATVDAEGKVTIAAGATVGQTVIITATATVEEDGEYIYPYWMTTSSYTVKLVPVTSATSQSELNDYNHGSW